MYTEEPRRNIDWESVIKKGLVILAVVAVVFLIVWLLTRNNSNSISTNNENNNSNVTETLESTNAYSEIFINNYRYFHDTAKEYFLISELPEKGKSIKYTLQELINKNLILPFTYGKETCSETESYVTVKNVDGKYTMITTLVCGKEVAKTTEELGCNQLCNNGTCIAASQLEYEYKQAYKTTETVYSCNKEYKLNGTKCVKTDIETIAATKTVKYNCDKYLGYTLSGNKCVKSNSDIKNATETVTYSCSNYPGYTLNGNKCVKTTSTTDTKNATATKTYSCEKGTLVNEKYCRITSTNSYYQSYITYKGKTYNGCTYSGSYTSACSEYSGCTRTYYKYYCTKSSYKDVEAKETVTYSCSNYPGYTLSGNKCVKTTSTTDTKEATKTTKYNCDNYPGYTLSGNKCIKPGSDTKEATKVTTYECPNKDYTKVGIGSSAMCNKSTTSTVAATKSTKEVTKYRYKWSTETSLEGWIKTGKTRKVSSK